MLVWGSHHWYGSCYAEGKDSTWTCEIVSCKSALQEHPTYVDLVTKRPDAIHAVVIEPLLT